jgi:tetratricopeptide (TPR) repeat protein
MQLVAAGKPDQAEPMLRALEKADPRNSELLFRFGLVLIKQGKLDEARVRLEAAATLDPKPPYVFAALGLLHESLAKNSQNDAPLAAKEFQEAIRLDPTRPVYYLELAQLLLSHDTPEPAELILASALKRFPKNGALLRTLGLATFAQGKNTAALDAFLKAIDADPEDESAYASLEVLLPDAQPRTREISAKLTTFSKRHPDSPVGPYLAGLLASNQAEELFRRAITAAPTFWPAWFELHKLQKAQGKSDDAAASLRKVIELNPTYAPAHYALAEYLIKKGDRAGAAREREIHHKLLNDQREADQKHRVESPRLAFTVEDR